MTPGGYTRCLVSWVGLIVRTTARRSYAIFLSILRLIRLCQGRVLGVGKDRAFRECGLGLSSQPTGQGRLAALTLAVPLAAVDITLPQSAVPLAGQPFDITLIPITPEEVCRYDRNVVMYANYIFLQCAAVVTTTHSPNQYREFEVKKGPLDCSE
jgi:hypothetical protein